MRVADIQRFCMHDGPGIRTTVFFKGCPLRCAWCHNPETQSNKRELLYYENKCIGCGACAVCSQNVHTFSEFHFINRDLCIGCGKCFAECSTGALELVGKDYTVGELYKVIEKDRAFYGENGGVTLSGGEPFTQGEDTIEFLRLCKENGINTAVETCGYTSEEVIRKVAPYIDLLLWDIKDTDAQRHRTYIGVSNELILHNLFVADSLGTKTRIRCILINGVNTDEQHYKNIVGIVSQLKYCEGVEFLPYHSFGGTKTVALGKFDLGSDKWIPSKEQIDKAKKYLQNKGVTVF